MSASAHVQKYSLSPEGHTEFFLKIFYLGREWGIKKRYRDFLLFDEYLKKNGVHVEFDLPPKVWWNRFDTTLLTQRQKSLQLYMDELLKHTVISENSLVKEFLEVDAIYVNQLRKGKSFRELDHKDRLKMIVKENNSRMLCRYKNIQLNTSDGSNVEYGGGTSFSRKNRKFSFTSGDARSTNSVSGASTDSGNMIGNRNYSFSTSSSLKRMDTYPHSIDMIQGGDRRYTSIEYGSFNDRIGNSNLIIDAMEEVSRKENFKKQICKSIKTYEKDITSYIDKIILCKLPNSVAKNNKKNSENISVIDSIRDSIRDSLRDSRSSIGSNDNSNTRILNILSAPLSVVYSVEVLLDNIVDSFIESSPKQSMIFYSPNDIVVTKFKNNSEMLIKRASTSITSTVSNTSINQGRDRNGTSASESSNDQLQLVESPKLSSISTSLKDANNQLYKLNDEDRL